MMKSKFFKKAVCGFIAVLSTVSVATYAAEAIKTRYVGTSDFSGVQGQNQWYYKVKSAGEYIDLKFDGDAKWSGDLVSSEKYAGTYITKGGSMHPGNNVNTARVWVAPMSGVVRLTTTDNVKKTNNKGDGLTAMILKDDKELWKYVLAGTDTTGTDYLVETEVEAGDEIYFEITTEKVAYCDTHWDPVVTYLQGVRFTSNGKVVTSIKDINNDLKAEFYDTQINESSGIAYLALYDNQERLRAISDKAELTFKSGSTYSLELSGILKCDEGYDGWRAEIILLTDLKDGDVQRSFPINISDKIVLK